MKHIGLFEGIGGFSLAARWMGWETIAWCEWNPFGKQSLKYHFPNAKPHGDIAKTDFTIYRGQCDILTGGFPCQPYSQAGKRLGEEDDRHLWPEMLRAIREIQPSWVVGENVRGLTNWNGGMVFDEVQADLEAEGYEVLPFLLPACAVNAPHRRDRIWFVAYANSNGQHGSDSQHEVNAGEAGGYALNDIEQVVITNTDSGQRCEGRLHQAGCEKTERYISPCNARSNERGNWHNFPTEPPICSRNDGVPTRLAGSSFLEWEQSIGKLTPAKHRNESIKAYGNAIVPHVALQIFKAIEQYKNNQS